MLDSRIKKIISDLVSNKARTLLVILAIAIGVFAFGSVFITQEVLLENMKNEYLATNPSTITLYLSKFDKNLVKWVEYQDGVKKASPKARHSVKLLLDDGEEESLILTSVPDYDQLSLNLLQPKTGSWPPKKGEIVLERNSYSGSRASIGDKLVLKTEGDAKKELVLTGMVYDNSEIPYIFTRQMSGFISWDTLPYLGFPKQYSQLDIATSEDIKTYSDSEKLAFDLTENLKSRGVVVNSSRVFTPNEHWAEDNSKAFTAILSVIGVFSLVLSGFLVVNTISAILTQQKKQIGIMKAVGGTRNQVVTLYIITVIIYGMLALLVALPIGMILGYVFLKLVADFLNLDIETFYLPKSVFLMQVAASLVVPVIAALIPIIQNTKGSIQSALSEYQVSQKSGFLEQALSKVRILPRPLLISLRNVFRKKGRLFLTLGTLIVAGAVFMGVINVRTGMYLELERILRMFDFEVNVSISEDLNVSSVEKKLKEISEVSFVEARNGMSARRLKNDGSKGSPFSISGLPPDTAFSQPEILAGRWLTIGDKNQVVLSSGYLRDNSDLSVGDILVVTYGENEEIGLEIVGVVAMSASEKIGFMDFDTVAQLTDKPRLASFYMMKTTPKDAQTQKKVLEEAKNKLERANIRVTRSETKADIFSSAANQFNFMIFFLLAMAVMVAAVGGLGLAGTMSLNVMERTREIGIMRSIGAGNKAIREIVLAEGVMVGIISWIIAFPLSLPMTYVFCYMIGNAFFERILVFTVVPAGIIIWLIIVLVISVSASLLPARRASKTSISETLAYE